MSDELEIYKRKGYTVGADGSLNPPRREPSSAKPERAVQNEPVAETPGEAKNPAGFHVHVISFRQRLTDPDNLCPKYHIDCLRYAEIIPNDTSEDIVLRVSQRKVKLKSDERTELIITKIP